MLRFLTAVSRSCLGHGDIETVMDTGKMWKYGRIASANRIGIDEFRKKSGVRVP